MDFLQETFNSIRSSIEDTKRTITANFDTWTDPADAVAVERSDVDNLRRERDGLVARLATLEAAAATERGESEALISELKASFIEQAEEKLDALDLLSVSKIVYDEIEATMGKFADQVRTAGQNELRGYGYQSKMMASLGLTFEAARVRIRRSQPFTLELEVLRAELADAEAHDIRETVSVIEPYAASGVASVADIVKETHALCSAVDTAHLLARSTSGSSASTRVGRNDSNVDDDDVIESGGVADTVSGWLRMLKLATPEPLATGKDVTSGGKASSNAAAAATRAKLSVQETQKAAADAAKANALRGDFDALLSSLGPLELPGVVPAPVVEHVTKLRQAVESRLVSDMFTRYCDSMIAVRRFSFVEGVVSPR